MKKLIAAVAIAAMAAVGFAGAAQADSRVKVGVLTWDVDPGNP
jgi:ABC-type proline/glycine betaine transport system substrate-binding protein